MDTCLRIAEKAKVNNYEMQIIGVPKTIDNDLVETDHTPGFGSAAKFIAWSVRDVSRDLVSMSTFEDVVIYETLGRNAGWLSASSILCKESEKDAPHLVYLPEVPFNESDFLDDVVQVHKKFGFVFVVVCEGIKDSHGNIVGLNSLENGLKDSFGHNLVTFTSGVASYLSDLVSSKLHLKSRFYRPGFIGRSFTACVSEIDREEAFQVGRTAIKNIAKGKSGSMISIIRLSDNPYAVDYRDVPLKNVANKEKLMPKEYFLNNSMVDKSFVDYALPLIDGPLQPIIKMNSK